MAYKARFRPLEQLTVDGWQAMSDAPPAPERRVSRPADPVGAV